MNENLEDTFERDLSLAQILVLFLNWLNVLDRILFYKYINADMPYD